MSYCLKEVEKRGKERLLESLRRSWCHSVWKKLRKEVRKVADWEGEDELQCPTLGVILSQGSWEKRWGETWWVITRVVDALGFILSERSREKRWMHVLNCGDSFCSSFWLNRGIEGRGLDACSKRRFHFSLCRGCSLSSQATGLTITKCECWASVIPFLHRPYRTGDLSSQRLHSRNQQVETSVWRRFVKFGFWNPFEGLVCFLRRAFEEGLLFRP